MMRALLRRLSGRRAQLHCGVSYSTYKEALAACGSSGYEASDVPRVVRCKTEGFIARGECDRLASGESAALIVLGAATARLRVGVADDERLSVLDVGGGCGAHYLYLKAVAPQPLSWQVVEMPAMVEEGRSLESAELSFSTAIPQDGPPLHLLHTSSTLQYFPDPEEGLKAMLSAGASVFLISRLPLTASDGFSVMQRSRIGENGPGPLPPGMTDGITSYPATFLNQQRFEELVSEAYSIVARIRDSGGNYQTDRGTVSGFAYLCYRKGS